MSVKKTQKVAFNNSSLYKSPVRNLISGGDASF